MLCAGGIHMHPADGVVQLRPSFVQLGSRHIEGM
jgi:hypothetical protein